MFTRLVTLIVLALGLLVQVVPAELPCPMCPGPDPSCQR